MYQLSDAAAVDKALHGVGEGADGKSRAVAALVPGAGLPAGEQAAAPPRPAAGGRPCGSSPASRC